MNRKTLLTILMALAVTACATDKSRTPGIVYAAPQSVPLYSKESSVELFSLDHGQPLAQSGVRSFGSAPVLSSRGRSALVDPSVTVFPFADEVSYSAPIQRQPISGLTPMGYAPVEYPAFVAGDQNVIYFNHGSAALDQPAREIIARVSRYHGGQVQVAAHASQRAQTSDPVERGILNFQMSMKRAMAVTKQLIRDGVPPEAIKATAYGDSHLAVPESDRASEAKNRRVQILTGAQ